MASPVPLISVDRNYPVPHVIDLADMIDLKTSGTAKPFTEVQLKHKISNDLPARLITFDPLEGSYGKATIFFPDESYGADHIFVLSLTVGSAREPTNRFTKSTEFAVKINCEI